MKVALLLSGQIRNINECFESINKNILSPYNPDVYIETWNYDNVIYDHRGEIINNDSSINDIIDMFNPKNISVEDFNSFYCNKIKQVANEIVPPFPETKPQNVLFQYYKIYKCFKQIYEPEYYDFIIRSRFDLSFDYFVDLHSLTKGLYIPYGWDHREGINDLLAFGDWRSMELYCSLYENITQYMNDGCIVHPEYILKYHLNKMNIQPQRPFIKYYLRNNPVFI